MNHHKALTVAITLSLAGCSLFGLKKGTSSLKPALNLSKGLIEYHTRHTRWPKSITDTLKYACMLNSASQEATTDDCIVNFKRRLNILSISQGSGQFFIYFKIKNCSGRHCGKFLSSITTPGKPHGTYKLAINRASL